MIYQKTEYEARKRQAAVAEGLKTFRELNGLSQAEMAALMRVSKRSYIDYEHGSRATPSDAILELSAWSNIDLNELFRGTEEAIPKVKVESLVVRLFQILNEFGALRDGLQTNILEHCLVEYLTTRSIEQDIDKQALKGIMVEELLKNGNHKSGDHVTDRIIAESLEYLKNSSNEANASKT